VVRMRIHIRPSRQMSHRSQFILSNDQYQFLVAESATTGLSMGELVRRAIDATYRPELRRQVRGFAFNASLWKRPDAATVGRRPGRRDLGID
jgi:hypothetical protein